MRSGWIRRQARDGRTPGRGRIGITELALGVALVWAGWAAAPAVESAARSAEAAAHGAAGQSDGSVLDGVFTESQASRGEATFRRVCSACHDTNEFSGGRFRLTWVGQSAGDLFDTIATLMPEGDPGSLTPRQYAGVVAYLLQINGYPAGEADLPTSLSALRAMEIVQAP
ncbi:MAG: cytochrome c [Acidobacteria bacterium]|nr:cytochrome c [Acidobacteriota bacterium]